MKYFVFSDIHGCIKELKESLNTAGYDPNSINHKLIFLGDAFDHNKSGHYETYLFLKDSLKNNKLIWIYGNHEVYLLNTLSRGIPSKFTLDTVRDIAIGLDNNSINYSDEECIKVLKDKGVDKLLLDNCINYYEINNYVFTHGFIPYLKSKCEYDYNWRLANDSKWNYFRCLNGQKLVNLGIRIPGKTLVCGHIGAYYGYILNNYPNIKIDSTYFNRLARKLMKESKVNTSPFNIYYGDGVIGLDSRSYDTKKVNVFVFEE